MNASSTGRHARQPRQLVVCCDGTNNTLTGGIRDTNVIWLHRHLETNPPRDASERVLYYDPGVGSPDMVLATGPGDRVRRRWERISALASGRGIYDNIGQAYLFLMRHWGGHEDRIYLFGFSRGAFTARAVAGLVNLFGIVRPEYEALVPTLIHIYFSSPAESAARVQELTGRLHGAAAKPGIAAHDLGGHPQNTEVTREALARQVRDLFAGEGADAWVHWVGVWDTVESVGLPGPLSQSNPSTATLRNKRIRNVRHALALHEHRWTFEPRLYDEPDDIDDGNQTLKQRWFPGVHRDVGGGYPIGEAGLSDRALHWMIDEVASDLGVPPLEAPVSLPKRHDALWDTPWWALAGMTLRDMHRQTSGGLPVRIGKIEPSPIGTSQAPVASVWEQSRSLRPVVTAMVAGLLCFLASGMALLLEHWYDPGILSRFGRAAGVAVDLAGRQLGSLLGPGHGFFRSGSLPWEMPGQVGWAMFWDLCFIAAWGYLLARVASRAFTWLAEEQGATPRKRPWRFLGFAPLVAVGGDIAEDLSVWFALGLHWMGTDVLAYVVLWLGSFCALAKFGGLVACLPLAAVRGRIAWKKRRRAVAGIAAGWLAVLPVLLAPLPADAQVAPSPQEAAAYRELHAAAYQGDSGAVQRQLAAGAALDARDTHGRTPLHVATFRGHHDVIRALAKAGADLGALENDRYDAVTIASVADDEATLRLLLSLGASARLVTSRYDGTALIAAAHLGHPGIVRQLVEAGAPLDHVNNLHWTAVIESIVLGDGGARHQETLGILIRAGADLAIGDRSGNTPLALARSRGYSEMVRMLKAAGAK